MIEIITKGGVSLDLCPDSEFEIEIESPLLADDRIPVPYSTSIDLLPTGTNCRTLGFIAAEMIEPSVKEIDVDIVVSGIPLFSGSIEYESFEEGKLKYNFAGKSIEDGFKGYIHEVKHLTKAEGTKRWLSVMDEDSPAPLAIDGDIPEIIEKSRDTDELDFNSPMIVCAAHVAKREFRSIGEDSNWIEPEVDPAVKYRNWYADTDTPFAPAVRVSAILQEAFEGISIDSSLKEMYMALAVLGLFSPTDSYNGFRYKDGNPLSLELDVADMLPECKMADLVSNVLKILGASLWIDGTGFSMLSNSAVIDSSEVADWEDKVSDIYSMSREEKSIYSFGYGNDDSDNTYNPDENIDNADILKASSFTWIMMRPVTEEGYKPVLLTPTGDIYSLVVVKSPGFLEGMSMTDIIYHDMGEEVDTEDTDENVYDATSNFKLVSCLPVMVQVDRGMGTSGKAARYSVCPIIDFPALDGKRPGDVYVGLLNENQLTDKGRSWVRPGPDDSQENLWMPDEIDTGISIAPQDLLAGPHKTFREWIERDRQVVSVDLNLSLMDIAGLRMYRKVYFKRRRWLIKKLSLSFSVSGGKVSVSGNFIEA